MAFRERPPFHDRPVLMPSIPARRFVATLALLGVPLSVPVQAFSQGSPDRTGDSRGTSAPSPFFRVTVRGQGRPLLLVPGLMSGGDVWDGTVAHLETRYRLHVVTLAGFAGVPAVPRANFLDATRDALLAYLRREGLDRPVVIGHSLGGVIAYAMASAAPDQIGGVVAVDGVPFYPALFDTAATVESMRPQANAMRAAMATSTPAQFLAQVRMGLPLQMRDTANFARAIRWAEASDRATIGQAMAELYTTDFRPRLSTIRAPVLQIGAVGAMPPSPMRAAAPALYAAQLSGIPHAELAIAERAHHFVMLDDPNFFLTTLDRFLARVHAPATPPANPKRR